MKGGPRAATALRRRRLDSTCGTTQPGPGAESWGGGWEHPWGGWSIPLGGQSIVLGGQEHPAGLGALLGSWSALPGLADTQWVGAGQCGMQWPGHCPRMWTEDPWPRGGPGGRLGCCSGAGEESPMGDVDCGGIHVGWYQDWATRSARIGITPRIK